MMHHYTTFGHKRFDGSEDISKTFTDILNRRCDLDVEHSNPLFSQDTTAYDDVPLN